jgi:hypothetical protein
MQNLKERERAVVVMTLRRADQRGCRQFPGVSEANVRVIRHQAIHQLRDCMGLLHERPIEQVRGLLARRPGQTRRRDHRGAPVHGTNAERGRDVIALAEGA